MFEVKCLVSERLRAIGNTAQRTAVLLSGGQSCNAVFIFIVVGDTTTLTPKACQTLEPSAPQALSTL